MSVVWRRLSIALAFVAAAPVHAAFVSYDLDLSNKLPDGQAYLRVTIDDEGAAAQSNFHVEVLDPLDSYAARKFGIQSFGFNSDISLCDLQITGLPHKWKVADDRKMSEFGRFDVMLKAPGKTRVESLEFSELTGT